MKNKIKQQLQNNLSCNQLEIIDQSHLHAGHNNFDGTGESHFKIVLSAKELTNLPKVKAHQKIYHILREELKTIHALSIELI